jgi:KDO2-lipid IV(A) lauroyltransferase
LDQTPDPETRASRPGQKALSGLARALLFLPTRLPLGVLRALGGFFGSVLYFLMARRRRIARVNVERARDAGFLPQDVVPSLIARRSFGTVAKTILEAAVLWQRGLEPFKGRWRILGREGVEEALELARSRSTGVIFLAAHTGPWELSPHVVRREFGIRVAIVGRGQGGGALDRFMVESRTGTGNTFIFKDKGAREMLKALRAGDCLGTLADQAAVVEREGAELMFMGRPARTNLGPFKLAAHAGAPLLPMFGRREGGIYVFEIHPFLEPPDEPDGSWAAKAAQEVNDLLGEEVRARPSEWMWSHRRWKTPEGMKTDPGFF